MKVVKILSLYMLLMHALCFQGPRSKINLILRNSNLKQTKMMLTYWIYTDGKNQVVLYLNTEIEIKDLPEGSKVLYASVFAQDFGGKYEYDFALCTKVFNSSHLDIEPTINDYYVKDYSMLNLTNDGQKFPQVLSKSLDTARNGTDDWVFEGKSKFTPNVTLINETFWEFKNQTKIWQTGCPVYRVLNTFDYQDFKFEIYKTYQVFGIFAVQLKSYDPSKPNETGYLDMEYTISGNLTTISLLDQASQIALAVMAIALSALIII